MANNPQYHHRRSIRLKGYDYSTPGGYFITLVTQGRDCLFGEVVEGEMICNAAGIMVKKIWLSLPERYPTINVDIFQVMPNHFHGIIIVDVGATLVVARDIVIRNNRAGTRTAPTVGEIVGSFKSITTLECIQCVNVHAWISFNGKLWQRNYYEHEIPVGGILRDHSEHERIARYILSNPLNWANDKENLL